MLPVPLAQAMQELFSSIPEIEQVFVYGSRAHGQAHAYSDIDLALIAPAMQPADFARLQYTLSYEMPTLIPIEIVRLDNAAPSLIEQIQWKGVVFYAKNTQQRPEDASAVGTSLG